MRWLVLARVLQGLGHAYGLFCFGLVVVLLEFGNLSAQRRRDLAFLLQLADERDITPSAPPPP